VAFNAIGVNLGGLLTAGVDALLGGGWIGDPDAGILAQISGTTLDVGGDLDVRALQSLGVNATVSNLSEITSSASFGASGMSASAVLASNRVQGQARALLEKSGKIAQVAGDLTVDARDLAVIHSNTRLVADSTTSSDGGLSLLRKYGGVAGNGARLLDDTQWAKFTVDVRTLSDPL
jgi:hypothetical protein